MTSVPSLPMRISSNTTASTGASPVRSPRATIGSISAAAPDHGRIARLLPAQNCGFILSPDGSEIYFHRNSVVNGAFEELAVGDEVRFVAQHSESAEGPQASTV